MYEGTEKLVCNKCGLSVCRTDGGYDHLTKDGNGVLHVDHNADAVTEDTYKLNKGMQKVFGDLLRF